MVELSKANPCDYIRFVVSALILLFSMTITSYAIVMQNTMFWKAVPGYAALIIFIVDLLILGIVEGLQIALVELKRQHPDSYKKSHPLAYRLGQMAAKGDNVERFLMGRQVFVVFLVFFCAKLTTIHLEEGEHFLFPTPWWVRAVFLESGILACIVVVILAQLMPQIVAAKYPVHFLQFFVMRPAYYCCVFVEITGLTHITWVLASFFSWVARMKKDEFKMPDVKENPDEIIKKIEENLDDVAVEVEVDDNSEGSDESSSQQGGSTDDIDTKCLTPKGGHKFNKAHDYIPKNQMTCFTHVVHKINQTVTSDMLAVVRHHLNQHPEKFQHFPSVVGNKMYPAPQAMAEQLKEEGHDIPRFLTDISDEEHVPPHIVACELLNENRVLKEELELMKKKLNAA